MDKLEQLEALRVFPITTESLKACARFAYDNNLLGAQNCEGESCQYRYPDGVSVCGVGAAIPNSKYKKSWDSLFMTVELLSPELFDDCNTRQLAINLQDNHDTWAASREKSRENFLELLK